MSAFEQTYVSYTMLYRACFAVKIVHCFVINMLFIESFWLQIDAEVAKLKELKAQLKEDETYPHDGSKKIVLKCPKVHC